MIWNSASFGLRKNENKFGDILRLREEQLDTKSTEYLSSHDVIVSTTCRLVQSFDEVSVTIDQRVRYPLFQANDGVNCLKQLSTPCDVGSKGVHTICHCSSIHFVRSVPGDTGLLFPIDDANFGLMHTFFKIDEAELAKTKWIKVVS